MIWSARLNGSLVETAMQSHSSGELLLTGAAGWCTGYHSASYAAAGGVITVTKMSGTRKEHQCAEGPTSLIPLLSQHVEVLTSSGAVESVRSCRLALQCAWCA
jgi:hypothetical protein